jgi:ribonucleoside-triphosphate reductase
MQRGKRKRNKKPDCRPGTGTGTGFSGGLRQLIETEVYKKMRTIEEIDRDLAAAREALLSVEETPAEVYSRIVGYYRSVRNWNRGKREEYGERRLYNAEASLALFGKAAGNADKAAPRQSAGPETPQSVRLAENESSQARLLLFVRPACPACPSAKEAAGRLGIQVDLVNADTEAGLAQAQERNVFSTPTAIFLSAEGDEIGRALDGKSIAAMGRRVAV